jgi:NADH-quinone oxidoreductase subunit L
MAFNLSKSQTATALQRFWFSGWGFDWVYDKLFIAPFLWLTRVNKKDFIDSGYTSIAYLNLALHKVLSRTQSGNIRWYAMGIAVGAVVFLGVVLGMR